MQIGDHVKKYEFLASQTGLGHYFYALFRIMLDLEMWKRGRIHEKSVHAT
jgi:hypothetical protein